MNKRNWEHYLISEERKRAPLCSLFAPSEFLTDSVMVTNSGHVLMLLGVKPVPYECLDDDAIDRIQRKYEAAVGVLDPEMRLYQFWVKRPIRGIPHRDTDHPVLQQALTERIGYLESRKLFDIEVFFAVVLEQENKPTRGLRVQENARRNEERLRVAAHQLEVAVMSFRELLAGTVETESLMRERAFRALRLLVNYFPEAEDAVIPEDGCDLDWAMGSSTIERGGVLRVGDYLTRVFTLKALPHNTDGHILRELYDIPCGCVLTTEWKPEPMDRMVKLVNSERSWHNKTKTSLSSYGPGKKAPQRDMLVNRAKQSRVDELGQSQEVIEKGMRFGRFALTVIVFDEDAAVLRAAAGKVRGAMLTRHGEFAEHSGKPALCAWLGASVPGNCQYSRFDWIVSIENYADMALLFAADTGCSVNPRTSSGEYLAVLENNHGSPYYLNLHRGQIANTLITGIPGSGKSYRMNFLITWSQKDDPQTVIFDIAGGFRYLTERFRGSYLELGRHDSDIRINPFCLEPTDENLEFLTSFVVLLLEFRNSKLSSEDVMDVYRQVLAVYRTGAPRLSALSLAPHLMHRLSPWIHEQAYGSAPTAGRFAYLFDNADDTVTLSRFQCLNFPQMRRDEEALEALLYYMLHRSRQAILAEPERIKWVWMDEAHQFLRHPATREYVSGALKTWRKWNAHIVLATHTLEDLGDDALYHNIVQHCVTKIHCANPSIDQAKWQREFHLTKAETALIVKLAEGRQCLIQGSGVVNLNVDPQWHWLYANSPQENVRRSEAFGRYGVEKGMEVLGETLSNGDRVAAAGARG